MRVLFLLILFFSKDISCQQNWKSFIPKEKDFEILFPGEPTVREKSIHTELGELISSNYSYKPEAEHPNFLYCINTVEYPVNTFSIDSTETNEKIMIEHIESLSELLKCEILYKNKTTINNLHDAWVFRLFDDKSGQTVKGIALIHKDVLYQITVYTTKDKSLNKDMDRFLESFKILD